MARNPVALAKAIAEIETVLGDRSSPTYEDISKLKYIDACFMEALRLNPPVQQLQRECAHDTIVLDKYLVRKGQRIQALLAGMHRDPEQWDLGYMVIPLSSIPIVIYRAHPPDIQMQWRRLGLEYGPVWVANSPCWRRRRFSVWRCTFSISRHPRDLYPSPIMVMGYHRPAKILALIFPLEQVDHYHVWMYSTNAAYNKFFSAI